MVARFNPDTGAVENLEIILFMEWIKKERYIDMYLTPYYGSLEWGEWSPEDGRLTLRYDKPADTLSVELDGARPYPAQKRRRVGDRRCIGALQSDDRQGGELRDTVLLQEDVEPGTAKG